MAENNEKRLQTLFQAYLGNRITEGEYREFWELLQSESRQGGLEGDLQALWETISLEPPMVSATEWDRGLTQLIHEAESALIEEKTGRRAWRPMLKWAAAAAAAVLLIVGAGWFFQSKFIRPDTISKLEKAIARPGDLAPGTTKAILTLSNGSNVRLDTNADRIIGRQGNAQVAQTAGGQLAYQVLNQHASEIVYNTLRTPRGGTFKLILPDGTRAWLNAASSLRFPTAFSGTTRSVEITGEVYFEVAEDAAKPFEVTVDGMQIKVLGTHFDVMAYDDEPTIKTTLLEGSVKIMKGNASTMLLPGQQAEMTKDGKMLVNSHIEEDEVVSWTRNLFWFDDQDIYSIMREVARWYNADVVIQGEIPEHFTGSIPRNVAVSRVFQVLQETGKIHYRIDNHKIIVTP